MVFEDYPLNFNVTIYHEEDTEMINKLADLGESGDWDGVFKILEKNTCAVNFCRLPQENAMGSLVTLLHQAAIHKAPKEVFEKLLKVDGYPIGASRTLKTVEGKTAYDIAKENELDGEILKLIEVPVEITQRAEEIARMEKTLHKLIEKRVGGILKANSQALPQLAYFYEVNKKELTYQVPGWYGGFRIGLIEKGLDVESWCRIMGGSGKRHRIYKNGKIKLKCKNTGMA